MCVSGCVACRVGRVIPIWGPCHMQNTIERYNTFEFVAMVAMHFGASINAVDKWLIHEWDKQGSTHSQHIHKHRWYSWQCAQRTAGNSNVR